jgi:hypothetical protein
MRLQNFYLIFLVVLITSCEGIIKGSRSKLYLKNKYQKKIVGGETSTTAGKPVLL